MELRIGIDDVDSPRGMCTTYAGAVLVELLSRADGVEFADYPRLIRLNPNVPFKTRGNGAVCLVLKIEDWYYEELTETLIRVVAELLPEAGEKPDPAIVICRGNPPKELVDFYEKALNSVLPLGYAERLAESLDLEVYRLGRKGRGLVGAMAAVGATLEGDCTFELLLYRNPRDRGPRRVDPELLIEIDRKYRDLTFANFDFSEKRLLATPRGPDPVVMGIRSSDPTILVPIARRLYASTPGVERWVIYRTNQGTDSHLKALKRIVQLRPYDSCCIRGRVVEGPLVLEGGHVKVVVDDGTGRVDCMFYKKTGRLNRAARLLAPGDLVEVCGGIRPPGSKHGLTLNAEKLRVLEVRPLSRAANPRCPVCGARMKSAGRGKGFKCKKCGFRSEDLSREVERLPRVLEPGLYVQSPASYRHLSRPLRRLGLKGGMYPLLLEFHFP